MGYIEKLINKVGNVNAYKDLKKLKLIINKFVLWLHVQKVFFIAKMITNVYM